MLVEHLSGMVAPAQKLMGALRPQSNAPATGDELDLLFQYAGSICEQLDLIGEQARQIRAQLLEQEG
jgi:hypothetical protein